MVSVVEKLVEAPREIIREVPIEEIVESIVQVPVDNNIEVPVEKTVEKTVEKLVQIPDERTIEVRRARLTEERHQQVEEIVRVPLSANLDNAGAEPQTVGVDAGVASPPACTRPTPSPDPSSRTCLVGGEGGGGGGGGTRPSGRTANGPGGTGFCGEVFGIP